MKYIVHDNLANTYIKSYLKSVNKCTYTASRKRAMRFSNKAQAKLMILNLNIVWQHYMEIEAV